MLIIANVLIFNASYCLGKPHFLLKKDTSKVHMPNTDYADKLGFISFPGFFLWMIPPTNAGVCMIATHLNDTSLHYSPE